MRNLPAPFQRPHFAAASHTVRPSLVQLTAMTCQMPPEPSREPERDPRGSATPPPPSGVPMECESLLRHASLVGYLTLDKYGKIVRVNECGAVLLGTSRGVLLGQPFQDYVATEDRGAFEVFSNQVFNSDDSCECQMTLLRKQPSLTKFCAQLSAVAVRRKGSVTRCLLTLIDISEFARSG